MERRPLHIISFDNPYPPIYGGVIDVFYKLTALHALGYDIYLHCFIDDDNTPSETLKKYTKQVFFYRRKKKQNGYKMLSIFPFAVRSRYHKDLLSNVMNIDAPILFEGQQTTFLASKYDLFGRKIILRLHNLEANYFLGQSKSEENWFRKIAYFAEYLKYKRYQSELTKFDAVLALSHFEQQQAKKYNKNVVYVPVFHGNKKVAELSGSGKYAFYHGDLRLADNRRAVKFLINAFKQIPDYPFLIASGGHGDFVEALIKNIPNISQVEINNSDPDHLTQLLANAHINVMLSFQESGTKLKLVNALYRSRFCVINKNMVDDENLRSLCTMAETEAEFIAAVNSLKNESYDSGNREVVLKKVLDDSENARKIQSVLEV